MTVIDRSEVRGLELYEVPPRRSVTDPRYWVRADCCTTWDVHLGFPMNRCGKCGKKPMIRWEDCE